MAGEDVIEEVAVAVVPTTRGFRAKLRQQLLASTRGVNAEIGVKLDTKGLRTTLTSTLQRAAYNNPLRVGVALDSKGLRADLTGALRRAERQQSIVIPVKLDTKGLRTSLRETLAKVSAGLSIDVPVRTKHDDELAAVRLMRERLGLATDIERTQDRAANKLRRAERDAERAARNAARDQRYAALDAQRSIREAERASQARRAALAAGISGLGPGSTLIDMGAEGVKPMRLLIAAGLALSPVLVAVGSSAGIAATSVAALGSAGLGAVAGITALTFGLGNILDVLKLKEQADKDATSSAAGLAATQLAQARAVKSARDQIEAANVAVGEARQRYEDTRRTVVEAIADERQAERDLAAARREAAADLRAQRVELRGYALDQAEAKLALDRAEYELRQFISRKGTKDLSEEDSFALRDARLNVARAKERRDKVNADQRKAAAEALAARRKLTEAERTGYANDDRVIAAQKRLVNARERVTDAQRASTRAYKDIGKAQAGVVDAQENLTDVQAKNTAALTKQSAAASQLAVAYGKLSGPAQTLVDKFFDAKPAIEGFRREIERAMVPGFLSFLDSMDDKVGGGASAFEVLGNSVVGAGKGIGSLAARLGKALRQPWFTGAMSSINRNNAKSFNLLGRAAITSLRPIMRIIDAASPLLVRFGRFALRGAEGFDRLIAKAEKTGDLARWFKTAGDELGKWWGIAKNLGQSVYNILKASFPAGGSLVERLRDFTGMIRDWTGSEEGQKSIKKFFDFFANIDYGKLFRVIGQLTALFLAISAIKWTAKNPMYALFALLAAEYPDATVKFLEQSTTALGGLLKVVTENPGAVGSLIALFGAWKLAGALGVPSLPKMIGNSIGDAVGSRLASRSGFLGKLGESLGRKAAVMNVTAATVNIFGGGLPGKGGKPGPVVVPPGGPKVKPGGGNGKGGARARLGTAAGTLGPLALGLTFPEFFREFGKFAAGTVKGLTEGRDTSAASQRYFSMGLPNSITGGNRGWSGFENVAEDLLGPGFVTWFSKTLPNALNLGVGRGSGWSGLASNLGHWFAITLPDSLNLGDGSGWSGLGKSLIDGLWTGIMGGLDLMGEKMLGGAIWNPIKGWFKTVFGIKSPSTKMMPFGAELINGLWVGLSTRLKAMMALFGDAGEAVVHAITTPFALLGSVLAGHFRSALAVMDSVFLGPVNTLLKTLKLTQLPTLTKKPAAKRPATGVIRPAGRAEGGPIPGHSPNKRADNIPIMATAKEWMMPVDAVEHYGPGFMAAVQNKRLPQYAEGGKVRGYANGGPIWPAMWNWVHRRFPQATLNSAQAGRGGGGYHPTGQAIDIGAPGVYSGTGVARDIFNAIKGTFFRNIRELIWDFAGSKAVWNGQEHFFTGAGAGPGTHADHIHWAMANFAGAPGGSPLTGGGGVGAAVDRFAGLVSSATSAFGKARARINKSVPGLSVINALKGTPAAIGDYASREATTFDTGGTWRPGTFGYNAGGGGIETVRTQSQEAALNNRVVRIDPRDLQKLANILIAAMTGQQVTMDGHTVGEIINRQSYLPAGV